MADLLRNLGVAAALAAITFGVPARAAAQEPTADPAPTQEVTGAAAAELPPAPRLHVSDAQLARIQRSLSQPSGVTFDEQQLRFYLEIVARRPSFAEFAKGYDFLNGPTRGGNPMSHQEFLELVTPQEMYSSTGITATDQLQFALTNWIGQSLIRKALEQLKAARTEREARLIRERIDRELEALTRSGRSR